MPRPKKVDANSNAPAKINNSQKKTTSSTPKQPTANEMREWYEKNKSRLERYEDATSAITSLRDIQKSSRYTSISNYSKEDVKSYIKNISSNEKNLVIFIIVQKSIIVFVNIMQIRLILQFVILFPHL